MQVVLNYIFGVGFDESQGVNLGEKNQSLKGFVFLKCMGGANFD